MRDEPEVLGQPLAPPQPRDTPGTRPPTDHARVDFLVGSIQAQLNRERVRDVPKESK